MQWDIVRAAARGCKKRFAPVLGLWHYPYEPWCVRGKMVCVCGIARCPEPKALALIPGADHFFLGREAEVAEAVVTFVTH